MTSRNAGRFIIKISEIHDPAEIPDDFCKTVVTGTVGVGDLSFERSSSETQGISVDMERWSVEHRAFAVETIFKNNDSVLTQTIFRRYFNIHREECP